VRKAGSCLGVTAARGVVLEGGRARINERLPSSGIVWTGIWTSGVEETGPGYVIRPGKTSQRRVGHAARGGAKSLRLGDLRGAASRKAPTPRGRGIHRR